MYEDLNKFASYEASTSRTLRNIKNTLKETLKNKYEITNEEKLNEILKTHGLSKENFDFIANIENTINNKINDVSIDDNSNKNEKTIEAIHQEMLAPIKKAIGYDYLYRVIKELYGQKEAKKITGEMYDYSIALADSTNILRPYCWSLDATKIVLEGRLFGQLYSAPAKRVSSYISALCETIHQLSNHLAGAIALGSLFLDLAHLLIYKQKIKLNKLKENEKIRKNIENELQQMVHSLNHLSRTGREAPFTNISIFDRGKLNSFLSEENYNWYFPINEECENKEYAIKYIIELQNLFLDFFDKGSPLDGGMPYRFPIVTLNISKEKKKNKWIVPDQEFLENIIKRDIFKYNIFTSEGTKIASCCFAGTQKVLTRNSNNEILHDTFENIYKIPYIERDNFKVFHNGNWVYGNLVRIKRDNKKLFKIETINNKEIVVTEDHLNPTPKGDTLTKDLQKDDYLLFNHLPLHSSPRNLAQKDLTYEQGIMIGAYLGDGSIGKLTVTQTNYSLNIKKWKRLQNYFAKALKQWDIPLSSISIGKLEHNNLPIRINNKTFIKIIKNWVNGRHAVEKHLNLNCLLQSIEFRQGIIKGMYLTDGGNNNRIYSVSTKLIENIELLLTSLGKNTSINIDDRTNIEKEIRGEKFKSNYPLFCIRWYEPKHKRNLKNIYKTINNSIFYKIKSIQEIPNTDEFVYCFEMKNKEEPYFTLPNGIVTHNCRLISDNEMMDLASQVNSFGAGSSISIGSHRVVTINLNRISLECSTLKEFYTILEGRLEDSAKILKAHKKLMFTLTEKGLQPFIKNGWINLNKMFSTYGILGYYECVETLNQKFGNKDHLEEILTFINKTAKEYAKKYEIIINIEAIPGESMAVRLPKIDSLLFGKEKVPYTLYSNQFVPLWENISIWDKFDIDGKYNLLITGGGIVHYTIGEKTTSTQTKKLIEYAIKSGAEHFALNGIYSICEKHHTTFGKKEFCPICNEHIIDHITRVVGFFTPVSSWNKERREWEFPKRKIEKIT